MLYKPTNVYPNNEVIYSENQPNFSFQFNGDRLTDVAIAYRKYTDTYWTHKAEFDVTNQNIYNGDIVNIPTVFPESLEAGESYVWTIVQKQSYVFNLTYFRTTSIGNSSSAGTGTNIPIPPNIEKLTTLYEINYFLFSAASRRVKINNNLYAFDYNATTGNLYTFERITVPEGTIIEFYADALPSYSEYYFSYKTSPTFTINPLSGADTDVSGNLNKRDTTITAVFDGHDEVTIKHQKWNLYNAETNVLLDSTDEIYSSDLKYYFNGYFTGNSYRVECVITTQDDISMSAEMTFNVLYESPAVGKVFPVAFDNIYDAVKINLGDLQYSAPDEDLAVDVDYRINYPEPNWVHINSGTLTYSIVDDLPLSVEPFSFAVELQVEEHKVGDVFILNVGDKDIRLITETTSTHRSWYVSIGTNSQLLFTEPLNYISFLQTRATPDPTLTYIWDYNSTWNLRRVQYFITNEASARRKYTFVVTSSRLYYYDTTTNTFDNVEIVATGALTQVQLLHDVSYNYFLVSNIDYYTTSNTILGKIQGRQNEPTWADDEQLEILVPFDNGNLISAKVEGLDEGFEGYMIYRYSPNDSIQKYIATVPANTKLVFDYAVANNSRYIYEIVPITQNIIAQPISTEIICVRFDHYTINTVDFENTDSTLISNQVWKFGLDTKEGALQQNINKVQFNGLSRYPKFVTNDTNYRSGTLTAKLSNMTVNNIVDTDETLCLSSYHQFNIRSCIYFEPSELLEKWNDEVVASGKYCLYKDLKGHVMLIQIVDSSATITHYNQVSPTNLNFSYTEIMNSRAVSVYGYTTSVAEEYETNDYNVRKFING